MRVAHNPHKRDEAALVWGTQFRGFFTFVIP
ncbi:hypothetical protein AciPR4_0008 [Terriglobus saanensis SP1PR4]|uniref:Uncharacterized protein n=1 Tax=Terriglobus saanensis (strain ATCC BAA-1853 / DSM 23119 / SP1PR4) TaxID=401053 RepID=E8UY40_TERSS|nr:hypothetical protein AciPR4_0008 [Terriglobus saanensis SP1PR4]